MKLLSSSSLNLIDDESILVWVMAWGRMATGHWPGQMLTQVIRHMTSLIHNGEIAFILN